MENLQMQVARERQILCEQFYAYLKNKEFIIWSSWDLDLSKMLPDFYPNIKITWNLQQMKEQPFWKLLQIGI